MSLVEKWAILILWVVAIYYVVYTGYKKKNYKVIIRRILMLFIGLILLINVAFGIWIGTQKMGQITEGTDHWDIDSKIIFWQITLDEDVLDTVYYAFYEDPDYDVRVKITTVYPDEDDPVSGDTVNDITRLFLFGRLDDIEAFNVYLNGKRNLAKIDFGNMYANDFDYNKGQHHKLIQEMDQPVINIYINTWNHAVNLRPIPGGVYEMVDPDWEELTKGEINCKYDLRCLWVF